MKLEIFKPTKPWIVNQNWGIPNPIYKKFGFSLHNGIDIRLGNGALVYAPFDCVVVKIGYQPDGGGLYVGLISANTYEFEDGKNCHVLVDALHLKTAKVQAGNKLGVGDIVAIADNTGFSTGPHTHYQFRRVSWFDGQIQEIDKNEANNSFDPLPYLSKLYAVDYKSSLSLFGLIKSKVEELIKLLSK